MTQAELDFDSTRASDSRGAARPGVVAHARGGGAGGGTAQSVSPPRSRSTDPASSHRAEQRLRKSGALASQRGAAQRLLDIYGPATASQLAEQSMAHEWARCLDGGEAPHVGLRTVALRKRLPELAAAEASQALFGREQLWTSVEAKR